MEKKKGFVLPLVLVLAVSAGLIVGGVYVMVNSVIKKYEYYDIYILRKSAVLNGIEFAREETVNSNYMISSFNNLQPAPQEECEILKNNGVIEEDVDCSDIYKWDYDNFVSSKGISKDKALQAMDDNLNQIYTSIYIEEGSDGIVKAIYSVLISGNSVIDHAEFIYPDYSQLSFTKFLSKMAHLFDSDMNLSPFGVDISVRSYYELAPNIWDVLGTLVDDFINSIFGEENGDEDIKGGFTNLGEKFYYNGLKKYYIFFSKLRIPHFSTAASGTTPVGTEALYKEADGKLFKIFFGIFPYGTEPLPTSSVFDSYKEELRYEEFINAFLDDNGLADYHATMVMNDYLRKAQDVGVVFNPTDEGNYFVVSDNGNGFTVEEYRGVRSAVNCIYGCPYGFFNCLRTCFLEPVETVTIDATLVNQNVVATVTREGATETLNNPYLMVFFNAPVEIADDLQIEYPTIFVSTSTAYLSGDVSYVGCSFDGENPPVCDSRFESNDPLFVMVSGKSIIMLRWLLESPHLMGLYYALEGPLFLNWTILDNFVDTDVYGQVVEKVSLEHLDIDITDEDVHPIIKSIFNIVILPIVAELIDNDFERNYILDTRLQALYKEGKLYPPNIFIKRIVDSDHGFVIQGGTLKW